MRSQFHAGDVCMSSAGVADIFKRRLLTLCSDVFETSQLSKASSGLSNDRCPTGYRLSLLCQFGYFLCVYVLCAYAYLKKTNTAQENIYIRRGLQRCRFKDAGNAKASKTWNDNSRTPRFLFMPILNQ